MARYELELRHTDDRQYWELCAPASRWRESADLLSVAYPADLDGCA